MIVPDLNLLVYAYDSSSPHHEAAAEWWEACINGTEPVGIPHVVAFGFVRLTTSARVFASPFSLSASIGCVREWLTRPHVIEADGGPEHVSAVLELLRSAGGTGQLATDAQIAAVAIHHRATVYTNDSDFGRFPGLQTRNPLES